jgi:hypothetical protein
MRCKKAQIWLSAWIDNELSQRDQLALERHLSVCEECAQLKTELCALSQTMSLWADEEPSQWLAQSFSIKLEEMQAKVSTRRPLLGRTQRWALGSAAAGFAVMLIVAAGLLLQNHAAIPTMQAKAPAVSRNLPPSNPKSEPTHVKAVAEAVPATVVRKPTAIAKDVATVQKHRYVAAKNHRRNALKIALHKSDNHAQQANPALAAESLIITKMAFAKAAQGKATLTVADNLGEASLAMNSTLERVRGTLQKAADLLVTQTPMPAADIPEPNGGTLQ